ncbi:ribbon-helix-helix domain-containing protein [Xylophilus sp. ASV27]|uniref:ribbon-helix-helix domain-containing protein n=1 Tax=Xylophilus sp. ASV27 TaxID=2795129 RepID=UPI0018ED4A5A|nr:CopG family transcriptional regulator [Xylophilus sp. ASV27]
MAVSVRMDPLLEKELELAARRQGVTKSQFIVEAVERALGRKNPAALYHQVMEKAAHQAVGEGAPDEDLPPHRSALRQSLRESYAQQQDEYAAHLAQRAARPGKPD